MCKKDAPQKAVLWTTGSLWLAAALRALAAEPDAAASATTACMCVDTFFNFMSKTNDVYRDDVARRLSIESRVGASTRAALTDVWDNVKQTHESTQLMSVLQQQQQAICEVRTLPSQQAAGQC